MSEFPLFDFYHQISHSKNVNVLKQSHPPITLQHPSVAIANPAFFCQKWDLSTTAMDGMDMYLTGRTCIWFLSFWQSPSIFYPANRMYNLKTALRYTMLKGHYRPSTGENLMSKLPHKDCCHFSYKYRHDDHRTNLEKLLWRKSKFWIHQAPLIMEGSTKLPSNPPCFYSQYFCSSCAGSWLVSKALSCYPIIFISSTDLTDQNATSQHHSHSWSQFPRWLWQGFDVLAISRNVQAIYSLCLHYICLQIQTLL